MPQHVNSGSFKDGHIPWCKGKKMVHSGSFKKGHKWFKKSTEGMKKTIEAISGDKNWNWKGGKIKPKSCQYIFIRSKDHPYCNKNGYVREARLVVESQIGRYLLPHERVHHVDEIKTNNAPQNLMAFTSTSAHTRFHSNPANVKPEEVIFDGRKLKPTPPTT